MNQNGSARKDIEANEPAPNGNENSDAANVEARSEISELNDKLLRALADADNARKRAAAARRDGREEGLADALRAFAPVLDNLDLALNAANDVEADSVQLKTLVEGLQATRKVFLRALQQLGAERLEPTGEPFDSSFCEAMSVRADLSAPPNTVLETIQPGYRVGKRLVRPACVIVSPKADSRTPEHKGNKENNSGEE